MNAISGRLVVWWKQDNWSFQNTKIVQSDQKEKKEKSCNQERSLSTKEQNKARLLQKRPMPEKI